jgi:UDP-glucose 4-epimerase
MRVLVSGGAGYIGSHTVLSLLASGHDVVVVDDFSNSKPTVMNRLESLSGTHVPVHGVDLTDAEKTERLFAHERFDAVVHFAGQAHDEHDDAVDPSDDVPDPGAITRFTRSS